MTPLAIYLLVAFVLLFGLLKFVFKLSILSPPMMMVGVWCSFIFTGLAFFWDYPWRYTGLIWIMFACLSFTSGYIALFLYKRETSLKIRGVTEQTRINISKAKILLGSMIVLASAYTIARLSAYGVSFASLLDITQLAEMNNAAAIARYSGEMPTSIFLQMMLAFVYAAPILAGFMLPYMERFKDKLFCLLSVLPVFLAFSVTNEKATFIASVFFVFSGFLVGYLNKYGIFPKIRRKHFFVSLIILVVIIAILISSMMLRIGSFDYDTLHLVVQKIGNSYALSHMPAFDSIFPAISHQNQLSWGQYTFYGIVDFLGFATRQQGVYQDYFIYQNISTNIYTVFRGLILDYGVIGALIFQGSVGAVTAISVNKVISGRQSSVAVGVAATSYAFILYSFIVSLFSYMSLIVALVLFVACCKYMLVRPRYV